jgi:hypothetical protein
MQERFLTQSLKWQQPARTSATPPSLSIVLKDKNITKSNSQIHTTSAFSRNISLQIQTYPLA